MTTSSPDEGARASHPSSGSLVLMVVRKTTVESMSRRMHDRGFSMLNDSFVSMCARCKSPVIVSSLARDIATGTFRADTAEEGCVRVIHLKPQSVVFMCDVCKVTPLPDPKTIKR